MNTELKEAIEALEKEKNIMRETLFEAIENALLTACKRYNSLCIPSDSEYRV